MLFRSLASDFEDVAWFSSPAGPHGEVAQDDIGLAMSQSWDQQDDEWLKDRPVWKALCKELDRRGVPYEFTVNIDPERERAS